MTEPFKNPPGYQPVYRALKPLNRVKCPDGIYRDINPGEPVPGAENWHNPHLWAKRMFLERIDGKPSSVNDPHGPYEPPHALTEEDVARIAEHKRKMLAGEPDEPPVWEKSNPMVEEDLSKQPSAVRDPNPAEMDVVPQVVPASPKSLEGLRSMSRGELFKLAQKQNLKVNGRESVDDLAKALMST